MNGCKDCKHFAHLPIGQDLTRHYECRANPPTTAFIPTQQGIIKVCGFPDVKENAPKCGQFFPEKAQ